MLFIFDASLFSENIALKSFTWHVDVNRLTSPNYMNWLRNLRIVLIVEKIVYILDTMIPMPEEGESEDEIASYVKYIDDSTLV